MIRKIDIKEKENALEVLNIQLLSYKIEAEIIGFYDIPPLKDTVEMLQHCGETFFGFYEANQLCGSISIKVDNVIEIHRLIVHPKHFRKGIAQKLLTFIDSKYGGKSIKVATSSKNTPALNFYMKNGFQKKREITINKQLSLTYFEKKI